MEKRPGSLSPIQTSSSQHDEEDDNHTEYYVEGGEKMTDKTLDVNASKTKDSSYNANVSTEPDAKSELAMQKESTYTKPAETVGDGTYSTTANSRNEEPVAGDTTEPIEKAASCCDNACGNCKGPGCGCCADCKAEVEKADACPNCGKSMTLCNCAGMTKADDQQDDDNDADSEPDADEDDKPSKEIKKSLWGGAFLPVD